MKKLKWKCLISAISAACFFCGCAMIECRQQIETLQDLSASQDEIKGYVGKQAELFQKLKEDIRDNRLQQGTSKGKIIARYGEPINCVSGNDFQETCVYRHPTEYFSSDHVYLYFDREARLYRHEIRPSND